MPSSLASRATWQASGAATGLRIDLLVVPECSNESEAATLLRTAMDEIGLGQTDFRTVTIDDAGAAARSQFTGSPTFMVDGVDLFEDPTRTIGLSCRLYRNAGGVAGVPDRGELTQALERATRQPR
jgi:hypothetical protein